MKIVDAILEVFEREDNKCLDYNEIYDKIDKSIFSKNKRGERGERSIVYRALSGNNDLFSVDINTKPRKFYLVPEIKRYKKLQSLQRKRYLGSSSIYYNNEMYNEVIFSSEEDFEEEVKNNYKLIFGSGSYYYDIKKKIGKRICDAFVFDKDLGKIIIVENEIFTHDLWMHIVPQIIDFFIEMKEEKNRNAIKYEVAWNQRHKLKIFEAIDKGNYDIVVVMDKIEFETKKVINNIAQLVKMFNSNNSSIIFKEFKTYINVESDKIHLVE